MYARASERKRKRSEQIEIKDSMWTMLLKRIIAATRLESHFFAVATAGCTAFIAATAIRFCCTHLFSLIDFEFSPIQNEFIMLRSVYVCECKSTYIRNAHRNFSNPCASKCEVEQFLCFRFSALFPFFFVAYNIFYIILSLSLLLLACVFMHLNCQMINYNFSVLSGIINCAYIRIPYMCTYMRTMDLCATADHSTLTLFYREQFVYFCVRDFCKQRIKKWDFFPRLNYGRAESKRENEKHRRKQNQKINKKKREMNGNLKTFQVEWYFSICCSPSSRRFFCVLFLLFY